MVYRFFPEKLPFSAYCCKRLVVQDSEVGITLLCSLKTASLQDK